MSERRYCLTCKEVFDGEACPKKHNKRMYTSDIPADAAGAGAQPAASAPPATLVAPAAPAAPAPMPAPAWAPHAQAAPSGSGLAVSFGAPASPQTAGSATAFHTAHGTSATSLEPASPAPTMSAAAVSAELPSPSAMLYQPPPDPMDADPVEELLESAGLRDLVDVFDELGFDDVEMIKEKFGGSDGVLGRLEKKGHRLTREQQQALRDRLGLVSVEVADLLKQSGLEKYADKFHEEGFDDVNVIRMYVTDVLDEIAMAPEEQARLRSALGAPTSMATETAPEPAPAPQPWPPQQAAAPQGTPQAAPTEPIEIPRPHEHWGATVHRLTVQGEKWREPLPYEQESANDCLYGQRLVVHEFGEGKCIGFEKKNVMQFQQHSNHVIDFSPQPHGIQKVSLKKKGNNERPWLIWNMCAQCGQRRQFVDARGRPTPYCGKTCKAQAEHRQPMHGQPSSPPKVPTAAWPPAQAPASQLPVAVSVPVGQPPAAAPSGVLGQPPAAAPSGVLGQPPASTPSTPLGNWLNSIQLGHHLASITAAGYTELDELKDDLLDPNEFVAEVIDAGNAADRQKLLQGVTSLRAPVAPVAPADYGELGRWLDSVPPLGMYKHAMHTAGYDLPLLRTIEDADLKTVLDEIVPADKGGHKLKLKRAVVDLRTSTAPSSAPSTTAAAQGQKPDDDAQKQQQLAAQLMAQNLMAQNLMAQNVNMLAPEPAPAPAAPAPASAPSTPPAGKCPHCHIVHGRSRDVHPGQPYCGKNCGKAAKAAGWVDGVPPQAASPEPQPDTLTHQLSANSLERVCCLCKQRDRYAGSYYCGRGCQKAAKQQGYDAYGNPPGAAKRKVVAGLRRLDPNQPKSKGNDAFKFAQISSQFVGKWSHPDDGRGMKKPDKGDIIDIFECNCGPGVKQAYEQYVDELIGQRIRVHGSGGPGNVHQRWHGTGIKCSLGKDQPTICKDTSCATCNIIRNGFEIKYCRTPGRYGIGLYASSTSSKAHQYAAGMSMGINGREVQRQEVLKGKKATALLLCKVAVGKGHLEASDQWGGPPGPDGKPMYMPWCSCGQPMHCKCPDDGTPRKTVAPNGCHSVLAQPKGALGGKLNYDEVAVYRNEAILPTHLVVYNYQHR